MMQIVGLLQLQGVAILLLLGLGWFWSAFMRRAERLRLECSGELGRTPAGTLGPAPASPKVTVVLPVKGCRANSVRSWATHLSSAYDGPLEFIFVADSTDDAAVAPLKDLLQAQGAAGPLAGAPQGEGRLGKGGTAATSAMGPFRQSHEPPQHTLPQQHPAGTGSADSGSCSSPSGAIGEALLGSWRWHCASKRGEGKAGASQNLQREASVLVAGPSTTCSQKIHNLCAGAEAASSSSELVLFLDDDVELHPRAVSQLAGAMQADPSLFMATGYPFDVPPPRCSFWAYCALVYHLPLVIAFSVRQRTQFVWGGCMMLRAEHLRPPGCHRYGLVEAWRNGGYSDDLVLAALCTQHGLHIAAPSFAIFPQWLDPDMGFASYWNYLRRQLYVLDTYTSPTNRRINHIMAVVHAWASTSLVAAYVAAGVATLQLTGACRWMPTAETWPLITFLAAWAFGHAGLVYMTGEVLHLLAVLDPTNPERRAPALSMRLYSWAKVWGALLLESSLLPACVAYTIAVPHVEWGNITYAKRSGRVARVQSESKLGASKLE